MLSIEQVKGYIKEKLPEGFNLTREDWETLWNAVSWSLDRWNLAQKIDAYWKALNERKEANLRHLKAKIEEEQAKEQKTMLTVDEACLYYESNVVAWNNFCFSEAEKIGVTDVQMNRILQAWATTLEKEPPKYLIENLLKDLK